jgi:hypothetical protein
MDNPVLFCGQGYYLMGFETQFFLRVSRDRAIKKMTSGRQYWREV